MSKHAKTNIVTKVLGYTTVAIVAGTAIATFLPSSYYSGAPLSDSATILSSVEHMASLSPAPAAVSTSAPTPVGTTAVKAKTVSKTATSTPKTVAASKS